MTRHILFSAAGQQLAVPARFIKAIHESLPVQPVEGTRKWFLGLSVAHGKLLPVTDLGSFSGHQASCGRTLEVDPAVAIAALKVDDVAGLSEMPARVAEAHSRDTSAFSIHIKLTGESVHDKGGEHQVLDLPALLQSPAFVNIKE